MEPPAPPIAIWPWKPVRSTQVPLVVFPEPPDQLYETSAPVHWICIPPPPEPQVLEGLVPEGWEEGTVVGWVGGTETGLMGATDVSGGVTPTIEVVGAGTTTAVVGGCCQGGGPLPPPR